MSLTSVLDNPRRERHFHGGVVIFSFLLVPPSALWLANSVPYIVALSVFAILYSAIASWQASKAEENLDKRLKRIEAKLNKL